MNYSLDKLNRISAKTNGKCGYCGSTEKITIDHMVPRSKGGSDDEKNLIFCCRKCNGMKSTKSLFDFALYLTAKKLKVELISRKGKFYAVLPLEKDVSKEQVEFIEMPFIYTKFDFRKKYNVK